MFKLLLRKSDRFFIPAKAALFLLYAGLQLIGVDGMTLRAAQAQLSGATGEQLAETFFGDPAALNRINLSGLTYGSGWSSPLSPWNSWSMPGTVPWIGASQRPTDSYSSVWSSQGWSSVGVGLGSGFGQGLISGSLSPGGMFGVGGF